MEEALNKKEVKEEKKEEEIVHESNEWGEFK
jgi:hypothetical protein